VTNMIDLDAFERLPDNLAASVDSITEAIRDLRVVETPSRRSGSGLAASTAPLAVAIMGDRGTGKTTLLNAVCVTLQEEADEYIVLPIMRPESFGYHDTVISTFLASLYRWVAADATERSFAIEDITRVSRIYASSRTPVRALEASHNPIDFAEDSLSVSRSSVSFLAELAELLRRITSQPLSGRRLIVVPIDDPDLAPELLGTILRDVRTLGSMPGIVPLLCFSTADMQLELLAERRKRYDWLPNSVLNRQIERELDKVFPHKYRYELRPLTVFERAIFVPPGRRGTLGRLVGLFSDSLSGLIDADVDLGAWLRASGYLPGLTSPLPANPRLLVQVWESLNPSNPLPGTRMQVASIIIQRLISLIERPLVLELSEDFSDDSRPLVITEVTDAQGSVVALEAQMAPNNNLRLIISRSKPFLNTRSGETAVQTSRLSGITGDVRRKGTDERVGLSKEAVSAHLALQELAVQLTPMSEQRRLTYLGEDDWRFLQDIRLSGHQTANISFLAPPATTFSDVCDLSDIWNSLVDLNLPIYDFHTYAKAHIALALAYLDSQRALRAQGFEQFEYVELFELALSRYKEVRSRRSGRQDAYCTWFEDHLPLQWHTSLLTEEVIETLAERHLATVMEGFADSRRAGRRRDDFLVYFDRAMRIALRESDAGTPTYLGGYSKVARILGSSYADRFDTVADEWRMHLLGERAGDVIVGASDDPSTSSFAEEATEEGKRLLERAMKALDQMETDD
jgi:hypothetical protein